MAHLKTYYAESKSFNQYIADMEHNQQEFYDIYARFAMPTDDIRIEQIKNKGYRHVLVITEDWCGDAMMNNPILKHIAEAAQLEVRVFYRDDNTDLIDQYLTNGTSRAIPIYIFMNEKFEQKAVWGPRAMPVQKFVERLRKNELPDKQDPHFEEKQNEIHQQIKNRYLTDPTFWTEVYESIVTRLV
ncbi:thioredoxin family protein [Staphylococcus lutrae]|uniref:Thioredoxin family protein n=1 Tax=Staphylococcus lutrae TaxID=155085 RepID=A0AAC9RN95_9STAP|nr:thioredoxin family protein [Staphylococcus lutrae]ARJ50196.1 thioredoxin family protein [Staphylococcus lutrae]PNZ39343.1 thioredoxin family protein [Staphylococcus lutrae]